MKKITENIGWEAGKDLTAQSYRAKSFCIVFVAMGHEVTLQKRVIKIHVMGNKYSVIQKLINGFSYLLEERGLGHHFISDACHGLYVSRNGLAGIDQCFKPFYYFVTIKNVYRN